MQTLKSTLQAAESLITALLGPEHAEIGAPDLLQALRAAQKLTPPLIGQPWPGQGGIYIGITPSVAEGQPDQHLILTDARPEGRLDWAGCMAFAETIEADGHRDFSMTTQAEAALIVANAPSLCAPEWHWASTQHADVPDFAWVQSFGYGGQNGTHKSAKGLARFVRRLPV